MSVVARFLHDEAARGRAVRLLPPLGSDDGGQEAHEGEATSQKRR